MLDSQPDDFNLLSQRAHIFNDLGERDELEEFLETHQEARIPSLIRLSAKLKEGEGNLSEAISLFSLLEETVDPFLSAEIAVDHQWLLTKNGQYREALEFEENHYFSFTQKLSRLECYWRLDEEEKYRLTLADLSRVEPLHPRVFPGLMELGSGR